MDRVKYIIAFMLLLAPSAVRAGDLDLKYPGEFWFKYDHNFHNDGSDLDGGRVVLQTSQGIEWNKFVAFVGLNIYRPNVAVSDSYSLIGVKRRVVTGWDVGLEQQFAFGNPDRYVVFTEYYKTWDLKGDKR